MSRFLPEALGSWPPRAAISWGLASNNPAIDSLFSVSVMELKRLKWTVAISSPAAHTARCDMDRKSALIEQKLGPANPLNHKAASHLWSNTTR